MQFLFIIINFFLAKINYVPISWLVSVLSSTANDIACIHISESLVYMHMPTHT